VAVLGTLMEFNRAPIPIDLTALIEVVAGLNPDLLCLDITPTQWQARDFRDLPPEYREALLPLADQTDIVVVPIAEVQPPAEPAPPGWRGGLIGWLRRALATIQRTALEPTALNQGWRHNLANILYDWIARLAGGDAGRDWQAHTHHLIQAVADVARRDPGRRILVVVNLRHCHHIRPALQAESGIEVVSISTL
jgi:hypothetical protein